ncbi:MAG: peptidylprolyl isomerase [Pyrinomonadaceae bacterium]|nr:peptidylprolyl isomerase [Pyrinomonadaceae bacterium]
MKIKIVVMIVGVVILLSVFGLIYLQGESQKATTAEIKQTETLPTVQPVPTETVTNLPPSQLQTESVLQPVSSPITKESSEFVAIHNSSVKTIELPVKTGKVAELPNDVAATVNEALITKKQLNEELNRLLISPGSHGGINADKKEELRQLALEELVAKELAFQEAKKIGLKASPTEINSSLDKIKKRYQTEKSFNEALTVEKITEDELKKQIERNLLLEKINKQEIENKSKISDTEAKQHYEANKTKFVIPNSLRLWNIVIKIETGKESQAQEKIKKIYQLLKEGSDFFSVAYKYSEDDYRIMGGDYGWIHRGQLVPELEQIVFNAKVNELSEPLQTSFGWQVFKVGEIRPEKQMSFEEAKEKIKEGLHKQRIRQVRIDFVNRLKSSADIKYNSNS